MDKHYNEMGISTELSSVLSHYDSRFIYDIVNDQINKIKSSNISLSKPSNIVAAWEANFNAMREIYGSEDATQIMEVRKESYDEIIDIICQAFNLNFTIEDINSFRTALILYDFFICNINVNIINFFSKFIYNERASLYDSLSLFEMKKNKDSSTLYAKRMYKDIKLAVIIANINKILNEICNSMEFDFYTFVSTVVDENYKNELMRLVSEKGNFFTEIIVPIINNNLAEYVTGIRLTIQELAISYDQIIYSVESEKDDDK